MSHSATDLQDHGQCRLLGPDSYSGTHHSEAVSVEQLCCRSGVNGDLISWFAAPGVSSACQEHIAELLQETGAYSISGNRAASQPAPGGAWGVPPGGEGSGLAGYCRGLTGMACE